MMNHARYRARRIGFPFPEVESTKIMVSKTVFVVIAVCVFGLFCYFVAKYGVVMFLLASPLILFWLLVRFIAVVQPFLTLKIARGGKVNK